ncbi:MAG: hypothetical protein IJ518_05640 [Clostridia bacterium]|nr:hypothetical protein [Clostridia bacterium]
MLKYVQTTFAVPEDKMLYRILFFDCCDFRSLAFSVTDSTSVLRLPTWATLSRKASDDNSRVVGSELNEENKKSKAKPCKNTYYLLLLTYYFPKNPAI